MTVSPLASAWFTRRDGSVRLRLCSKNYPHNSSHRHSGSRLLVSMPPRRYVKPPRASAELRDAIQRWNDLVDIEDRVDEAEAKTQEQDEAQLEDAFCKSMAFGTAGLRAKEGLGFNRMNEITVALTSQGIADYILKEGSENGGDANHEADSFFIREEHLVSLVRF